MIRSWQDQWQEGDDHVEATRPGDVALVETRNKSALVETP